MSYKHCLPTRLLISKTPVWIYLTNADIFLSNQVFKPLFDAVINEKHLGFGPNDKHPAPDLDASKVSIPN